MNTYDPDSLSDVLWHQLPQLCRDNIETRKTGALDVAGSTGLAGFVWQVIRTQLATGGRSVELRCWLPATKGSLQTTALRHADAQSGNTCGTVEPRLPIPEEPGSTI